MEINGYGYMDFTVLKSSIEPPSYRIPVEEGLFILNLHDGREQEFKPIQFELHSPSEHTVSGEHYDVEL